MSEPDRNVLDRECGADVAAYALGALEPAEAEAVRRHLETCSVYRDELAAFQEVVNALPMTAPAHQAPAGLHRRVLRAVEDKARLTGPACSRSGPRPWCSRRLAPRRALALGAALAVAVVAVIGLRSGSSSGGARVIHAQVTGPGAAQLRITRGHGDLVVSRLAAPPPGQIYEVWVKRGARLPAPTTALFRVNAVGAAHVGIPGSLHGVTLMMVTPEPAGGSLVPTHPAVITARLT